MEGIRTKLDTKRGFLKYLQHDTEQICNLSLEHPINIQYGGVEKIQFKLLDQDIVYNHYDEEAQAYETVNHPLTSHTVTPGMY